MLRLFSVRGPKVDTSRFGSLLFQPRPRCVLGARAGAMILEEAEAVVWAATRQALDAALDAYRDAGAALITVRAQPISDGAAYQAAARRLNAACANLQTCSALHFGQALPQR